MVLIRLARGGANKRPFYHVVVADSRRHVQGKFIERLGFYNPKAPEGREALRVYIERVKHWQRQGARLHGSGADFRGPYARRGARAEGLVGVGAARGARRAGRRALLPRGSPRARGGERAGRGARRGKAALHQQRAG